MLYENDFILYLDLPRPRVSGIPLESVVVIVVIFLGAGGFVLKIILLVQDNFFSIFEEKN